MANILTQNPIVFTGPLATSYKAAAGLTFFVLRVKKITWVAPQAAGDTVRIVDPASGVILWRATASPSTAAQAGNLPTLTEDWTSSLKMWNDFAVPQMDSGTLYIDLA